ncbi:MULTISPECIES: hypothetical protein [Paraburkholderia]|uniref:Uncharacterized protein n=1 Tax=Paraburkholderia podalyriae TaxID=1938811 RepID=A0ABR7PFQ2_9BURK|nr:hypothetical protein [Paraburkholderia podalyriae]MBC8745207.1 hypothetical protein [Paraburkholderia podalyriae]
MDSGKSSERIHYLYWIGILSSLLIYSAVSKFTPEPKFTEYLGNAAAGISIVLGVVAIFYSFISNNNLSASLGNITGVSESLKLSESKIGNVLDQSKILIGNHDENIKNMRDISQHVQSSVLTLSETLAAMSSKTDELQQTIRIVPMRLDSLKEMIEKEKQPVATVPQSNHPQGFSPEQASSFNAAAPVSGNFITYACVLANKHDRELSIEEVCKLIKRNYPSLLTGFMHCMYATGLVSREVVDGKNDTWKIVGVDEEIAKDIRPYFSRYIELAFRNDAQKMADYLSILEAMENFYSGSPTS